LDGRTVVEVGCGTGKNTTWLAARCRQLIGLDFSAGMLRVAKNKGAAPNVSLLLGDIRRPWPLRSESADVLLLNLVLEHIEVLDSVFQSAGRVMAPNGWMIISEFHPERILQGDGAQIAGATGEPIEFVGSFAHTIADYEACARRVSLHLESTTEWFLSAKSPDETEDEDDLPLILSLRLRKH
jgi:malonyl-CoA O-methyltransferase